MKPYVKLDAKVVLDSLTIDDIERVYEGAPGCGCGCRGEYSTDEQSKRRVLRYVRRHSEDVEVTACGPFDVMVLALETSKRYRWIYPRESARVAEIRRMAEEV